MISDINGELWIEKEKIRDAHEKLFEMFDDFNLLLSL